MRIAAAALLFCTTITAAQEQSDWERRNIRPDVKDDQDVAMPAALDKSALIEFFVSAASDFRFFIDGATLSVGDGIVRYVLVARSPSGVENVSYEGMRCSTGEYRRYASGRADGSWVGTAGGWRAINAASVMRWHQALHHEYFCPQWQPIASAEDGIRALQRGGDCSPGDATGIPCAIPRGR